LTVLAQACSESAMLQSVTPLEITLAYWASKPWENEKEEPILGLPEAKAGTEDDSGSGCCVAWES